MTEATWNNVIDITLEHERWGHTDIGTAIRNRLNAEGIEWKECERIAQLCLNDMGNPTQVVIHNEYGGEGFRPSTKMYGVSVVTMDGEKTDLSDGGFPTLDDAYRYVASIREDVG